MSDLDGRLATRRISIQGQKPVRCKSFGHLCRVDGQLAASGTPTHIVAPFARRNQTREQSMGALLLARVESGEQGFSASNDCAVYPTQLPRRLNRNQVADAMLEQLGQSELKQRQT